MHASSKNFKNNANVSRDCIHIQFVLKRKLVDQFPLALHIDEIILPCFLVEFFCLIFISGKVENPAVAIFVSQARELNVEIILGYRTWIKVLWCLVCH
jgi:hypothetical protein